METKYIQTPALILDLDVFDENARLMNKLIENSPMRLRPHYKSHKCTRLAHMQIQAGAKGICCAKVSEAFDLAEAGIEDILIANEVTDLYKIAQAAYLAKCCYLTLCVDSLKNIDDLQEAAARQNSQIHCLIEYEVGMRRCGVSSKEEFLRLAEHIKQCPNLVFEGIQAYAGHLSHEGDFNKRKAESHKIEAALSELIKFLESKGIRVKEVSGTSTGTIEFRPKDTVYTEVQPGSYIFMDTAYNSLKLGFKNSLFILSSVMSVNSDNAITDAGLKVVSVDQEAPAFREYPDETVNMSEEHSSIPLQANLKVGDLLHLIPGHCCTTVNLHDYIYFVRNNKVVDKVEIISRGRSL